MWNKRKIPDQSPVLTAEEPPLWLASILAGRAGRSQSPLACFHLCKMEARLSFCLCCRPNGRGVKRLCSRPGPSQVSFRCCSCDVMLPSNPPPQRATLKLLISVVELATPMAGLVLRLCLLSSGVRVSSGVSSQWVSTVSSLPYTREKHH